MAPLLFRLSLSQAVRFLKPDSSLPGEKSRNAKLGGAIKLRLLLAMLKVSSIELAATAGSILVGCTAVWCWPSLQRQARRMRRRVVLLE